MSSHREAPGISQDPVPTTPTTYAFVSPDDPTTVTILNQLRAARGPPGGPNFFEFGDDVLYSIYIDTTGTRCRTSRSSSAFKTKLRTRTRSSTTPGPIAR
jgi:hypothetical protein